MWNAAVPAGQYAEHSGPVMVRHANAAPSSPNSTARARAPGRVELPPAERVRRRVRLVKLSSGSTNVSVSQNA